MSTTTKEKLHEALQQLTYGFYVVATRAAGENLTSRKEDWVSAGTVSWAMQTSFQPPLITIAIQKDSNLNETIQKSQAFSLTILGKDEQALIERFANNTDVDYANNSVNGVAYKEGTTGAPILDCGVATIDCSLHDALTTDGDHLLFVGYVEDVIIRGGEPVSERDTRFAYAGSSPRS